MRLPKRPGQIQTFHGPGVKGVQVPFGSLKPIATFKVGGTADWVLVTDDAVKTTGPITALVRTSEQTGSSATANSLWQLKNCGL